MFDVDRKKRIMSYLTVVETASPAQIQSVMGASLSTIRRDLRQMENEGLVLRSHGYVQLASLPGAPMEPSHAEEKRRIGQAAAALVQDGDTIFLGSGTTCTYLGRYLSEKKDLTIMTNNFDVVLDLTRFQNFRVSILGGEVQVEPGYVETMDEYTILILKRLYFDKVFVTVNGIDFKYGYSILKQLQLNLYQHLLDNCKDFYCLADSSKFNKRTYVRFCGIDDIHKIVTTAEAAQTFHNRFAEARIQVVSG